MIIISSIITLLFTPLSGHVTSTAPTTTAAQVRLTQLCCKIFLAMPVIATVLFSTVRPVEREALNRLPETNKDSTGLGSKNGVAYIKSCLLLQPEVRHSVDAWLHFHKQQNARE